MRAVAGKQMGTFIVPQIGAGVWVEFEHGDPDYPIWVGGFWGSAAEVPALALPPAIPAEPNIVLQTTLQNTLVISDVPPTPLTGGIMLKSTDRRDASSSTTPASSSRTARARSLMMVGPTVTINNGALVVI